MTRTAPDDVLGRIAAGDAPVVGSARVTAAAGAILRGVLGANAPAESVGPRPRSS